MEGQPRRHHRPSSHTTHKYILAFHSVAREENETAVVVARKIIDDDRVYRVCEPPLDKYIR